jgi:hypothetical protein
MQDGGRRYAAGQPDPIDDRLDRRAGVPHLVDDQHAVAVQQRIARELQEQRLIECSPLSK